MAKRFRPMTWLVAKYTDVREHRSLGIFGKLLDDPYLFHLNERSVPLAFAIGFFCAWIPLPSQMILSAAAAIVFRANLPISVLLVWVTNPITIPPMFYFAYVLGTRVLDQPARQFEFELSFDWMMAELGNIGTPLLIGCTILAIASASLGYLIMRFYWNKRLSRLLTLRVQRHQRYKQKHLDLIKKGKHGK